MSISIVISGFVSVKNPVQQGCYLNFTDATAILLLQCDMKSRQQSKPVVELVSAV